MPKKSDILIYDAVGSEFISKLFNNNTTSIFYSRNEFICVPCLLLSFFNRQFWKFQFKKAYTHLYIKFASPKIVITFIDTNLNYYLLKDQKINPKIISVQNGTRTYYGDIFELLDKKTKDRTKYQVDYLIVFGEDIGKNYKKHINGSILPMGSLKNNFFLKKEKTNYNSLCFISQYNPKSIAKRLLNKNNHNVSEHWEKTDGEVLSFLKDYCIRKNKTFTIIPRFNDRRFNGEKDYYNSILGSNLLFSKKSSIQSGYNSVDNAEVVVSINSTLAYESAARGNKTAFFSIRGESLNISDFNFGWPGDYQGTGKFWTNKSDPKIFEKILNYLFSINDEEWKLELDRIKFSNVMQYDSNNINFKSLIKTILE